MTPSWVRQLPPAWAWAGILQHQLQYRFGLKPKALNVTASERSHWQSQHQSIATALASNASVFQTTLPSQTAELIQKADQILQGQYDLLGHLGVALDPLNWHQDFITKYDWRSAGPPTTGSDIKRPWELSRCHHLVTLAQAFALTQEPRYAEEIVRQLEDWITNNPVNTGIHWRNPMEVSIRSANWLMALELCGGINTFPAPLQTRLFNTLVANANFIYQHLELAWPRTNHLLSDACGLIWLGVYFAPLPAAKTWRDYGLRLLTSELNKQIGADGCAYEGSSAYHLLDTEMLVQTLWWVHSHGSEMPRALVEHGKAMLSACATLLLPDGALPVFGDSDSGRWVPLESDRHTLLTRQDPHGVLGLGSGLLDQPLGAVSQQRQQSAIWLLGKPAEQRPSPKGTLVFPNAKWGLLHNASFSLAITAGNTGTAGWGGHGHNDALSFELCLGKKRVLVDAGSGNYSGQPEVRNQLRSTAAHNTAQIAQLEQNQLPERELFRLNNDVVIEEFEISQRGAVGRIRTPHWTHKRQWQFEDAQTLRITDKLSQRSTNAASADTYVHFHFAPGAVVTGRYWACSQYSQGQNLIVAAMQPSSVTSQSALYAPAYDALDKHTQITFAYSSGNETVAHVLIAVDGVLSPKDVEILLETKFGSPA